MPICALSDLFSSQNHPRTVEPFAEFRVGKEYEREPLFTVARQPKEGLIPLFKLYMSLAVEDPSEMTFVEEVFGDFGYWMILCDSPRFKPLIEEWRYIASVKRKQKAFKAVMQEVTSEKPSRFAAAKYLIEEPWKGGPTATERKKARKQSQQSTEEAFQQSLVQEDLNRLKEEGLLN